MRTDAKADFDVLIVGSGHGGAQSAIALRQQGFEGSIAVISKDSVPPYEKPPLSKDYLAREKAFDRLLIRPERFWQEKDIGLVLGTEVTVIDPEAGRAMLTDGRSFTYGELIWSAGGSPRRLTCEGGHFAGVHAVRDKRDVDRLIADLDAGARRVVVIGGGYIGLEAASVLTKLGCDVVLLEALDRVLARVAGEELSRFFEAEHRAKGVDLRLGVRVECLEGVGERVCGVRLDSGEVLSCDMVIVGIGIEPIVAPLARAGAKISNGVVVDEFCRTTLPHVYAVGDCAVHANTFANGATIRLESVQNANDMATTAAKAICGKEEPHRATPWFWSNQYDLRLQTVGLSQGHDATVVRGTPATRSFSVVYLSDGRVIALDCVNATKDFVQGRKLVEAGAVIQPETLADPRTSLKDLLTGRPDAD